MSRALHGQYEVIARLTVVHRQLVIFACNFPQAVFNPLQSKITILCANTYSLNNFHAAMLTD